LICGKSCERATPAVASAWRVRASATRKVGLPASASSINLSSCGSCSDFHQSLCGHDGATAVPASDRAADNSDALRGSACVDNPAVLAQAPTSADAQSRNEMRAMREFMRSTVLACGAAVRSNGRAAVPAASVRCRQGVRSSTAGAASRHVGGKSESKIILALDWAFVVMAENA
jgi:hypothetical protein